MHILLVISVGLVSNVYIILGLFVVNSAFSWGLSKIDEGYQLQLIRKSNFKATLLSMQSQIESGAAAIIGFSIGWIIEQTSYKIGFVYIGIVSGTILTVLYMRMTKIYKNQ